MKEMLKVALIGAASPQWGHKISRDLIVALSEDEIRDHYAPVLVMEDIDEAALAPQIRLAEMTAQKAGGKVKIESATNQKKALEGARFVIISFAVGSMDAMKYDLEIPAEYGIYQPVGDTISIGGAIRAVRNIPSIVSIARDIEQYGHEKAWIFNLANPMSTLCRAITRETKVQTIGFCHELYGGLAYLTRILSVDREDWRNRFKLRVCGINHCSWMQQLTLDDGRDALGMLREYLNGRGYAAEQTRLYDSDMPDLTRSAVKFNLFLRYGVLPYSGDRHNAEFFTEFINDSTDKGADYGVLLTTIQERKVGWRGKARTQMYEMINGTKEISLEPSSEAAGKILPSLLLGKPRWDVSNLPYYGNELPGVPQGAVIERMAMFDKEKVTPDPVSALPEPVQKHMALVAGNIEDIVEASIAGNRGLLIEALKRDLLLQNMQSEKIPELVDRLLKAHRAHVHPGFF